MAVPTGHRSGLWRSDRLRVLQEPPAGGSPTDAPGAVGHPEPRRLRLLGDAPGQPSFHQLPLARPPAVATRTGHAVLATGSAGDDFTSDRRGARVSLGRFHQRLPVEHAVAARFRPAARRPAVGGAGGCAAPRPALLDRGPPVPWRGDPPAGGCQSGLGLISLPHGRGSDWNAARLQTVTEPRP